MEHTFLNIKLTMFIAQEMMIMYYLLFIFQIIIYINRYSKTVKYIKFSKTRNHWYNNIKLHYISEYVTVSP